MNYIAEKLFKLRVSVFYAFFSFFVITILSILYFSLIDVTSPSYVTHDSIYYNELSKEHCADPLVLFSDAFKDLGFGGLNWVTIVSIGSVACAISNEYSDVLVLIINLVALFLTLMLYSSLIGCFRGKKRWVKLFYLLFVLQLFLYINMVSLNKEIYSFFIVSLFLYLFLENKKTWLFIAGIFFSILKIQFFPISIILLLCLYGVRLRYVIVGLSLVLPIIYWVYNPAFLSAEIYFARYENIRTEGLAVVLNEISKYPLGYVVVLPFKMLITLLSGLSPIRITSVDSVYALGYQFNAVLFSVTVFSVVIRGVWRGVKLNKKIAQFVFAYSAVICLLPFFQLRYFLPIFPVIWMLFSNVRSVSQVNKSTSEL